MKMPERRISGKKNLRKESFKSMIWDELPDVGVIGHFRLGFGDLLEQEGALPRAQRCRVTVQQRLELSRVGLDRRRHLVHGADELVHFPAVMPACGQQFFGQLKNTKIIFQLYSIKPTDWKKKKKWTSVSFGFIMNVDSLVVFKSGR